MKRVARPVALELKRPVPSDIAVAQASGFAPSCAVVVATVRALKMHGGRPKVVAGKSLDAVYKNENLALLRAGLPNLERHVKNVAAYGIPVVVAIAQPSTFKHLYDINDSIENKILAIAKSYGAAGVDYSPEAAARLTLFTDLGYGKMPICMAKTHLSFSDQADLKGAPTGFRVTIRDMRASLGAGFVYPLVGTMRTMPGLPARPAFCQGCSSSAL